MTRGFALPLVLLAFAASASGYAPARSGHDALGRVLFQFDDDYDGRSLRAYAYDERGPHLSESFGGLSRTFVYDDADKLLSGSGWGGVPFQYVLHPEGSKNSEVGRVCLGLRRTTSGVLGSSGISWLGIWSYANLAPTRYVDPSGRCVDQWFLGMDVLGANPQECRNYKNATYEYLGLKPRPKAAPPTPAGVSCNAGVNCSPALEALTPQQIAGLPADFIDAVPYGEMVGSLSSAAQTAPQAMAWERRLAGAAGGASAGVWSRWQATHNEELSTERVNELIADIRFGGAVSIAAGVAVTVASLAPSLATPARSLLEDPLAFGQSFESALRGAGSELRQEMSNIPGDRQQLSGRAVLPDLVGPEGATSYQAALGLSGNSEIGSGVLREFAKRTGASTYVDRFGPGLGDYQSFESTFGRFANEAQGIHFNLRGIDPAEYRAFLRNPSLSPGNVTNWELKYLLENAALRTKTTFYDAITGAAAREPPSWTKP